MSASGGIYSYSILGNEFAVVGPVTADVKFYEGEKRISTCTFTFDVTSDTLDGIGSGTAGYSDTLERLQKAMEKTEGDMTAVQQEMEKRGAEIISQAQLSADAAATSKNAAAESEIAAQASEEACSAVLDEVRQITYNTQFAVDFATGKLLYNAPKYVFAINYESGKLEWGVR